MLIREMSREECCRSLAGARLGRLACAHENQPYVVPIHLAYDAVSGCLYGFTTPGQKVEWMRANPLVCVEVDEITADDQWVSVVGLGRYEELSGISGSSRHRKWDEEGYQDERERAWQLLKTVHPIWWEPGCAAWAARVHRDPAAPFTLIYFRIWLDHLSGHEAIPDAHDAISGAVPAPEAGRWSRLRGTLMRVFGGT